MVRVFITLGIVAKIQFSELKIQFSELKTELTLVSSPVLNLSLSHPRSG